MILMPPAHRYRRLTFITSVILATALTPGYAAPEPTQKTANDKGVTLNFVNEDIRAVISAMSKATGKNFLIDPRVNGKITILSASPLRKESLYDVFLDALRTHNYVAIEQGDVIKIVPLEEAKQNPASTTKAIPGGAEQITRVVKIKSVSAAQLVPVLRPLMPREAYLQAYMDTNTLVISDSEKNLRRLLGVIKTMDKPNQDQDQIVPLSYATADEVLRILKETQQKKTETSATVTADKRSNSIIISGNKTERERYIKVIKHLDTPIASHSATHVVALKYAKSVDLAPLLDKIINRTGSGTSNASSSSPSSAPGVPGAPPSSAATSNANSTASNIVADEATNSLIISAELQSYQSILEVLKQLDIPRQQVMIEAIIAEVSVDNANKLGIEWGVSGSNVGAMNTNGNAKNALAAISTGDVANAFLTSGFSAIIGKGDIVMMINALKNDTNANILSAPRILTLDNKEAEMVVGENVPFPTGTYTQPTGGAATNPFTTVQRQDVGLILKVKPQINQGGMISLEITQETSAVKASSNETLGPTTTKRSMKSNVAIADGNMLALGGLMDDQTDDVITSIPLLGDIPLLGWLFKTQETKTKKRTLMVFIRPTIVDSQTNNNLATQKAISEVEKEQKSFSQRNLLLTPDAKRYQITPPITPLPELDFIPKTGVQ